MCFSEYTRIHGWVEKGSDRAKHMKQRHMSNFILYTHQTNLNFKILVVYYLFSSISVAFFEKAEIRWMSVVTCASSSNVTKFNTDIKSKNQTGSVKFRVSDRELAVTCSRLELNS